MGRDLIGLVTVWFRLFAYHFATLASKAKGLFTARLPSEHCFSINWRYHFDYRHFTLSNVLINAVVFPMMQHVSYDNTAIQGFRKCQIWLALDNIERELR